MKRLLLIIFAVFGLASLACLYAASQSGPATPPQTPASANRTGPLPAPAAPTIAPLPQIPADHRAEFFKRQLALNQAQQTFSAAQSAFQSAIAQLAKDCGEKFLPQISQQAGEQQGDPVCVARSVEKPVVEKPASPKKESK